MFGRIMDIKGFRFKLEMKPLRREDMKFYIPGFQQHSVLGYLSMNGANTIEDEEEWFDKTRKADDVVTWGIYADGKPIGSFGFRHINRIPLSQAENGITIFDKKYWGRGIATAVHRAANMYAFEQLGLVRIKSAYYSPNIASYIVMEKLGFVSTHTERNAMFVDNELVDLKWLECINPYKTAWNAWWHGDDIPVKNRAARDKAMAALDWAHDNVELV